MKNLVILFLIGLCVTDIYCQEKKETIYLLFNNDNKEECKIGVESSYENPEGYRVVKRYRKKIREDGLVNFYICDEIFTLEKKKKIDTCNLKFLNTLNFETLEGIKSKRNNTANVFKNSVFKEIYLIEIYKNNFIKYPVIWSSDLTQK